MAVASGRAGWVLAQPLSYRLKVHMCTSSTCEGCMYVKTSQPSCLEKWLPIIVQISKTKGNVALGFSAISVYSMVIPYCDKARVCS